MPAADGFVPLFNGRDLTGWTAQPRQYGSVYPGGPSILSDLQAFPSDYNEQAATHAAVWSVEDGAIVGRQEPAGSGWGGYLVSDEAFGDFELRLAMKPDWPADTGVMIRRRFDSWEGLQVLVDHRRSGSIGGFYGNGIAGFHAVPYALDAVLDGEGRPSGLRLDDPATSAEPFTPAKRAMLTRAGDPEAFLAAWRWADWNDLRVVCVGAEPTVTVWVNDVLTAEIDLATLQAPHYSARDVHDVLGDRGHIAFEVHDNDPGLGEGRWGRGAVCRWRDVRIRPL